MVNEYLEPNIGDLVLMENGIQRYAGIGDALGVVVEIRREGKSGAPVYRRRVAV